MNITKLALAAAIALGTIGISAAPAAAQPGNRGDNGMRHNGDNGRDGNGMRGDNGRHRGWYHRVVCHNVWRHHHRQRVCHRR